MTKKGSLDFLLLIYYIESRRRLQLTYSFLKGKRGLLKFQVVDILQQRDFVNRWMNDTGQGETWTWGLGRYAMATFTYRFNDLSR